MEISQEIIDNVIAAVGDDTQLLKQCTLVSSSFLRPSRKQLFSKISLKSDQNCKGIHQVLIENPVIQSFVKTITVVYSWDAEASTWMKTSKSLLAILRLPFSCLECLSIVVRRNYWNRYPWTWNSFNKELKDALANIVHISTLKTLTLNGIVKAPSSFFSNIDHLTTLELYSITPYDFVVDENSNSSSKKKKKKASKEVVPMASQTVIDRCVWYYWDEHERGTKFPSSAYFSLIQDGLKIPLSLTSCHSCAVYASLKSTSSSAPDPCMTLTSCPSSWDRFASASHLLPHSNTWS